MVCFCTISAHPAQDGKCKRRNLTDVRELCLSVASGQRGTEPALCSAGGTGRGPHLLCCSPQPTFRLQVCSQRPDPDALPPCASRRKNLRRHSPLRKGFATTRKALRGSVKASSCLATAEPCTEARTTCCCLHS